MWVPACVYYICVLYYIYIHYIIYDVISYVLHYIILHYLSIYLSIYIYIHGNGKFFMNGGFNGKILNGGFPLSRLTSGLAEQFMSQRHAPASPDSRWQSSAAAASGR